MPATALALYVTLVPLLLCRIDLASAVHSVSCGNGAVYAACDQGYLVASEGLDGAYHVTYTQKISKTGAIVRPCVSQCAREVAALVYGNVVVMVRACMLV